MRIAGEGRPRTVRNMLRPRRHPGLVALAAAAMVAATVGGFVATSTHAPSSAVGRPSGAPHGTGAAPAAPDGLVASGAGAGGVATGGTGVAGSGTSGSGVIACPMIPGGADTTGSAASLGSASHLFTRTTGDGVAIRAYRLAPTVGCACGPIPNGPTVPPSSGSSSGSAPTAPGAAGCLTDLPGRVGGAVDDRCCRPGGPAGRDGHRGDGDGLRGRTARHHLGCVRNTRRCAGLVDTRWRSGPRSPACRRPSPTGRPMRWPRSTA